MQLSLLRNERGHLKAFDDCEHRRLLLGKHCEGVSPEESLFLKGIGRATIPGAVIKSLYQAAFIGDWSKTCKVQILSNPYRFTLNEYLHCSIRLPREFDV